MNGKAQIRAILKCIDDSGQVVDSMRVMDNLMKMDPHHKMVLADILNGFIKYERDVWAEVWLEE